MSFEGFYQKICTNGHYFECDVYDDRDNCVDCFQPIIFSNIVDETNCEEDGYIRIPQNNVGDVDKTFFEKYLSTPDKIAKFKERNKKLVSPYYIKYNKKKYPLEKLIELFQYFDNDKTLKIEFKMDFDEGNQLVPYVICSFGKEHYDTNSNVSKWETMYIDDYGQETNDKNAFECFKRYYEGDVYSTVFELYNQMWNRCFAYRLKQQS